MIELGQGKTCLRLGYFLFILSFGGNMEPLGEGWKIFAGTSDSKITNGLWSEDYADEKLPDLEVVVHEICPNGEGCIHKTPVCENATTTDPIGDTSGSAKIPRQDTIRCQYMGGNNVIVPCIHIGEQVWVLHYEGSDMWYWLPMARHRDLGIRQHEHLRWFAMNRCKSVKSCNEFYDVCDDCTYFIDINTNCDNKLVQIHTAKNDGEFCGYDIRIYPTQGRLEVMDTLGNELSLDSKNTVWYMYNIDNSYLELNKQDITMHCERDMFISCGRDMDIKVGRDQTINIGNKRIDTVVNERNTTIGANDVRQFNADVIENTAGNYTATIGGAETRDISSTQTITVGGAYTLQAARAVITASAVSITGGGAVVAAAGGALSLKGAVAVSGPSFNCASGSGMIPALHEISGTPIMW